MMWTEFVLFGSLFQHNWTLSAADWDKQKSSAGFIVKYKTGDSSYGCTWQRCHCVWRPVWHLIHVPEFLMTVINSPLICSFSSKQLIIQSSNYLLASPAGCGQYYTSKQAVKQSSHFCSCSHVPVSPMSHVPHVSVSVASTYANQHDSVRMRLSPFSSYASQPDYMLGDEHDLIKPKKLPNPVKASRSHQELHRELLNSCKR